MYMVTPGTRTLSALLAALLIVGCSGSGSDTATDEDAATEHSEMDSAEHSEMATNDAHEMAGNDAETKRATAEAAIEEGAAGQWMFGADMTDAMVVSVTELNENPAAYAGKTVRIEGQVSSVCKNMGCWVEVQGAEGGKIMVASENHDVFVPRNSEGKAIVVEGMFTETPGEGDAEPTYSLDLGAASVTSAGAS